MNDTGNRNHLFVIIILDLTVSHFIHLVMISLSSGILYLVHLGSWIHDMWQNNIQESRFKIKIRDHALFQFTPLFFSSQLDH